MLAQESRNDGQAENVTASSRSRHELVGAVSILDHEVSMVKKR